MTAKTRTRILACVNGPHCIGKNPQAVVDAFIAEAKARGVDEKFEVVAAGCVGMCKHVPNMRFLTPCGRFAYCGLTPFVVGMLIDAHSGDTHECVETLRLKF